MQFSFRDAPGWFNRHVCDEFLDEFHNEAKKINALEDTLNNPNCRDKLLDFGVSFFNSKGIYVEKRDWQIWFTINENDPKWLWPILKWSEE